MKIHRMQRQNPAANKTDTNDTKYENNQQNYRPQSHEQGNGTQSPSLQSVHRRSGGHSEGRTTRSHPELGRENPPRRWYCVLRRGRVGRRQAFHGRKRDRTNTSSREQETHYYPGAGWSSLVARQAHNLKVVGSNPTPATNFTELQYASGTAASLEAAFLV